MKTKVLHLGGVSGGDAASLYDSILKVIRDEKVLLTEKFASFASDGAAVMTGKFSLFAFYLLVNIFIVFYYRENKRSWEETQRLVPWPHYHTLCGTSSEPSSVRQH